MTHYKSTQPVTLQHSQLHYNTASDKVQYSAQTSGDTTPYTKVRSTSVSYPTGTATSAGHYMT